MILVDANLLIYAQALHAPEQPATRTWLDSQINSGVRVGMPWLSLLAFLRISTDRRVFPTPHTMESATRTMQTWLACDNVWIPQPTERHADILVRLLVGTRVTRDLTSDAHLAALAIEHGLTLCSADSDFARFKELRWINPLDDGP